MHGAGVAATPARNDLSGRGFGASDAAVADSGHGSGNGAAGMSGSLPDRHYVLFGAVSTATLAVALMLMIGTLTYMHLENLSLVDALYLTTGVITTVGLVVVPRTMAGRAFTAVFNFMSLGLGVLLLTEIAEARRGWTRGVAERVPFGQAAARGCASLFSRGFTWLCTCACCRRVLNALAARRTAAAGGANGVAGVGAGAGAQASGGGAAGATASASAASAPSASGFAAALSGGSSAADAAPTPLPPATALILGELVWYVASAAPLILAAAAAFHAIEGWPLWESLYFCLITGSGLGMGDVEPRHWTARLVFCMYVWSNMGAVLGLLGSIGILLHDRANASVAAAARVLPGWCGAPSGQGNGNSSSGGSSRGGAAPQLPTSLAARTGGAAAAVAASVAAAARGSHAAANDDIEALTGDAGAAGAAAVPQKLLFSAGRRSSREYAAADAEPVSRSRSRSRQRSFLAEASDAPSISSEAASAATVAAAMSAPPTFGTVAGAADFASGRASLQRHFSHAPFTLHASRGSADEGDGGAAAFFARAPDVRDNDGDADAESHVLLPPQSASSS